MRKKTVAGNWKMNTLIDEGAALAQDIVNSINEVPSDVQLILAPPFTHLDRVGSIIKGTAAALSAQNCADKDKGAYTGEVSAAMLSSAGCSYVILGHSERREYYHETSETLNDKITLALANGLQPIFCVGEKLEEREAGRHFEVVGCQIKDVLFNLSPEQMGKVVVAYEPVWAIGTGKTATAEQAQEIHAFIRSTLAGKFGTLAEDITILYGGSCKPSNARELFAQKDIDGGLIGGAALKAADFIAIAKSF
ncbi:MAG TPA: triose-phosphate isomerase [Candidatus Coprenecus stercoravium]|uniref:Triosephosphate isomerase n=1 Tax=Candidatus Coprenecus stercoravium TaxID=2840735 RepID=A0A9D2GR52_9BACT|nr:triose-phosphate isomerase [Candidatus Coprenecus stercoravium]